MRDLIYFDSCLFIELMQQDNRERYQACEDLRESPTR